MITVSPWWWLLALFALLPWMGPWRGRDRVQNALRTILFIALAAALSRPLLVGDDAPPVDVLIVDQSESVALQAREESIRRAIEYAGLADRASSHIVVVGELSDEDARALERRFASLSVLSSRGPEGSSPLSAALTLAGTLIPRTSSGAVIIVSDALATRRDDARAIAALRRSAVAVHVVRLAVRPLPPRPVGLSWDGDLRVGTSTIVTAVIAGDSAVPPDHAQSCEVSLRTKEGLLATVQWEGFARTTVALEFEPPSAGFIDAELVVTTIGETEPQRMPVVLAVQPAHQVMHLGHRQKGGSEQLSRLLGSGFEIRDTDPNDELDFARSLSECELVLMDDFPADSLSARAEQQLIRAITHEGLGLVMSGGRGSFGAGGWHDRPLESLLPVELVQKEEKRDPSTSLVVVIDTSGSMGGVRVQLAKEVARLAIRRLLPHDKVGIVEFYGAKRWAAPIQPASNSIELQRALNRMDAGGGTVILPALEEAFYGLQNVDTRYKHVLVLTDGGVESGDFESLMRRMAGEGINVSTVLTGGGYHSEFLVNIANWGKGRFYNVPNRFNLPEILLKQPSTAKLPAYRPGVHRVRARGGSGWWGDVDTKAIPALAGYVEAKRRSGSEVLLETVADNHPVLATWRYGLGRVTTLSTEPVGEGTRPWRDWPDYGNALARVLERGAADTRDPFRFRCVHDGGELHLQAIRQRPRNESGVDAVPLAKMHDPRETGKPQWTIPFVTKSPDRFVAKIPAAAFGETLRIEATSSTSAGRRRLIAAPSPVVGEFRVDPNDRMDLALLASVTGGKAMNIDSDWRDTGIVGNSGKRLVALSSWLFGIALVMFLAEIVWRRRSQFGS